MDWWIGVAGAVMLVAGSLWIFTENDEGALIELLETGLLAVLLWIVLVSVEMIRFERSDAMEAGPGSPWLADRYVEMPRSKIVVLTALMNAGSAIVVVIMERVRYGIGFDSDEATDAGDVIFGLVLFWSVWWAIQRWPKRHDRLQRGFTIVGGGLVSVVFMVMTLDAATGAGFFFFGFVAFAHGLAFAKAYDGLRVRGREGRGG